MILKSNFFHAMNMKSSLLASLGLETTAKSPAQYGISIIISWLPEFLLSLQVKLITNTPSMTSCWVY